jgi:hypothetical protein
MFQEININWKQPLHTFWLALISSTNLINQSHVHFIINVDFLFMPLRNVVLKSAKKSVLIYNLNSQNIWKKSSIERPVLYQTTGAVT